MYGSCACSRGKRKKLDARSITCVLLGVSEESKAYRLYDFVAKKIIISRDVVFEENKSCNWDKSYEEQMVVDLNYGDEEDNAITDAENKAAVSEKEEVTKLGSSTQNGENEIQNRRPPVWMRDYVIGKGLLEEEEDANVNKAAVSEEEEVTEPVAVLKMVKMKDETEDLLCG